MNSVDMQMGQHSWKPDCPSPSAFVTLTSTASTSTTLRLAEEAAEEEEEYACCVEPRSTGAAAAAAGDCWRILRHRTVGATDDQVGNMTGTYGVEQVTCLYLAHRLLKASFPPACGWPTDEEGRCPRVLCNIVDKAVNKPKQW